MKFRFSWRISLVCLVLIALMVRASFWQWARHQDKVAYIEVLKSRLDQPVVPLSELLEQAKSGVPWSEFIFRRVQFSGELDFSHEMTLRNRRHQDVAGVFVLTPTKLESGEGLLVSRGFIPMDRADRSERVKFQHSAQESFTGIIKEGSTPKFMAPSDPPSGGGNPWVDSWLRVDLDKIAKQLPYPLLPIYVETISDSRGSGAVQDIVKSASERSDVLTLVRNSQVVSQGTLNVPDSALPIPVYDTVIPPGRHLGYVYEWAFLAIITALIGVILQLRRPS